MTWISCPNWSDFQHYKDRDPPWIKLHRQLLDNYEWSRLHDASKAHLLGIWLLLARHGNRIPADAAWIGQRISASEPVNLQVLIDAGLLKLERNASTVLAGGKHLPIPEAEAEGETEGEYTHTREVPPMFARLVARMQREPDRWAVVDFIEAQAKPEGWLGPITAALDGLDMPGGKPASPEAVAATCRDFMTKADHERTPHFFRICVAKFMAAGRPSGISAADKMARTDAAIAELRSEGAA